MRAPDARNDSLGSGSDAISQSALHDRAEILKLRHFDPAHHTSDALTSEVMLELSACVPDSFTTAVIVPHRSAEHL
jgi:hypothetical protein